MSNKIVEKKETLKEQDLKKIEQMRQAKKRKKELKQQQQFERKRKEEQALIDKEVQVIYKSGLADAYKYFLQQAYREEVKFNIYEYAAQKVLKFNKLRKEKVEKLNSLAKSE